MKLIYFHGFGSSAASRTIQTLKKKLEDFEHGRHVCPADVRLQPYLREPRLLHV